MLRMQSMSDMQQRCHVEELWPYLYGAAAAGTVAQSAVLLGHAHISSLVRIAAQHFRELEKEDGMGTSAEQRSDSQPMLSERR